MSWRFWLLRRVSELTCLTQKRNTDSEIVKEYRAVTYLAVIVPLYFFLWQILGCLGLGAYVASKRASTAEINAENPWYARDVCPVRWDIRQLTPFQGGLALLLGFRLSTTAG